MLKRSLLTALLAVLACAPAVAASPRAHSAAEQAAEATLEDAQRLLDGRGVRTGRELTESLRELSVQARHLRGDERDRAIALLSRPTDSDAPSDERYTAPELPPLCDANFCVHSVGTGLDAAGPGMAALTLAEANAVRLFENGELGWREPPSDGDGRVDIYLKELGAERLFGFASTDPEQETKGQHAYLVIDNDFDPAQYGGTPALESLRVTLAHEYAHVLQYGYDVLADTWHYESSAVWVEQRMYPEVKDWLRYVRDRESGPGWSSLTELSLTYFEQDPDAENALDPRTAKPYGGVVWNQFLSAKYGAAGDAIQLGSWQRSNGLDEASTAAYDSAIRRAGGRSMSADFADFSAAAAEWRVPSAPFPTPSELPDVERRGSLVRDGAAMSALMDHLTFGLYDIPETSGPIRLAASFPAGTSAAIALVGRSGTVDGGEPTTELLELPDGGAGGVTIEDPAAFYASGGRVTAVLVNSDTSHGEWSNRLADWSWSRDDQVVRTRVSSDVNPPRASLRRLRMRSRDAGPITFAATLRQDGRVIGVRSGRLDAGATRRLRFGSAEGGRARLVVQFTDPSANTRRLARTIRLPR